ncbi:hypothetical protein Avbf_09711 [Armadillidium vulgare]|nr:hypothetical protein Avbf_09711 [Armadillidium vulgare]
MIYIYSFPEQHEAGLTLVRNIISLCLFWLSFSYCVPQPLRSTFNPSSELFYVPEDHLIDKRVFLSRGWGPGGYEVPSQGIGSVSDIIKLASFIRNNESPLLEAPRTSALVAAPSFTGLLSPPERERNEGWKSSRPSKEKPDSMDYRRFHSIFTSGTWSPLGKRSLY